MSDNINVMREAISHYDKAIHLKKLNEELYEHLIGSIYYILKYSEKHNLPLTKKEALLGMLERTDFIIEQIFPTTKNQQPDKTTDDSPEPIIRYC